MKIRRIHRVTEGFETVKHDSVILTEKGNENMWKKLIEKCWDKCSYSRLGIPDLTITSRKIYMRTKTGHEFEFQKIG